MGTKDILELLGGFALFLYGKQMMSNGLETAAGNKLRQIPEKLTDNRFLGVTIGAIITVMIQSSFATVVMAAGFVSSGIMSLQQAVWIIMGANIGTTITSQILRLTSLSGDSWISLFTPQTLAPIFILLGVIIMEISKNKKSTDIGQMIMGIGLLFTGMITMIDMASSFSKLPILSQILATLSNPILGVIAGALITALLQSSAATVGILQAISTSGIITYATTLPIILGQNIGTCATSIFGCVGGSKNAKRAAAVHLYFNLIGTIIFLIVIYTYQYFIGFTFWNSSIDMGQIANFHTFFNVVSTIMLLPFVNFIEKLTILTIRDKQINEDDDDDESDYLTVLNMLDEKFTKMPNIAIINSTSVVEKMIELAEKSFRKSMELLGKFDRRRLEKMQKREDAIDKIEEKVTGFLVELGNFDLSDQESKTVTTLLKIESEFEKVGDYTFKFSKIVEDMNDKNIKFSESAYKNCERMYNITEDVILNTIKCFEEKDIKIAIEIEALKEYAEVQREQYRNEHIERLKEGKCNVESGIAFLEILTICEKVIDHCSNVSIFTTNYMTNESFITKHEFFNRVYKAESELLKNKLNECGHKYAI